MIGNYLLRNNLMNDRGIYIRTNKMLFVQKIGLFVQKTGLAVQKTGLDWIEEGMYFVPAEVQMLGMRYSNCYFLVQLS